ncbi:MAG: riboflavin biosynthesis protein RibF, partial [Bacteroidia bacterium]|nr:riboflavin biosynthesis protein RibF [Bacteroidia bacterium]
DLYNETLIVHFISRLRDEMKFGGLVELTAQLSLDCLAAIQVLKNINC